jgi:hypothetical protein
MADPYLAIAAIAQDVYMNERLRACVTQEASEGTIPLQVDDAQNWVVQNAYVWAASPGWGTDWQYALDTNAGADPPFEPGKDPAVITDEQILSAVQALIPSRVQREQAAAEAPEAQREDDTAQNVQEENAGAPSS